VLNAELPQKKLRDSFGWVLRLDWNSYGAL